VTVEGAECGFEIFTKSNES